LAVQAGKFLDFLFSGASVWKPANTVGEKMSRNGQNGVPAYRRIQAAILKRIERGQLKPGDAVNSERELAKIHSVSLMTARHALAALEKDGVVERRRSAGTFVAPPKIHFNKLMSFSEQLSGRNIPSASKVLSCNVVHDEQQVAAALSLPHDAALIKLERLRMGSTEPFALETCYLSEERFSGLNEASLERGSLFSTLEHRYGVDLAHSDEEIDATGCDPKTSKLLGIPKGFPLLRFRQVIYSGKGRPTLYVLGLYRSDRHTLVIRRYR
jgi:GntR family transcriptional regulator